MHIDSVQFSTVYMRLVDTKQSQILDTANPPQKVICSHCFFKIAAEMFNIKIRLAIFFITAPNWKWECFSESFVLIQVLVILYFMLNANHGCNVLCFIVVSQNSFLIPFPSWNWSFCTRKYCLTWQGRFWLTWAPGLEQSCLG